VVKLDTTALDAVVGGLKVSPGGSVQERQAPYTWLGMNYTRTERTAFDADGNVVATETYRPGTIWSDHSETNASGTRTTYDIGANGLAAQLSTRFDANNRFQGAGLDARFAVNVDHVRVAGGLRGSFDLIRNEGGDIVGRTTNVHGDVGAAYEPSRLGVRLQGDYDSRVELLEDMSGKLIGVDIHEHAASPLDLTYGDQRLVGINLLGLDGSLHRQSDENGGIHLNGSAGVTVSGTTVSGEGHAYIDGPKNLAAGFGAGYERQIMGPFGADGGGKATVDFELGDVHSLHATSKMHGAIFGQDIASVRSQLDIDQNGVDANVVSTQKALPDLTIPDVSIPDLGPLFVPSVPPLHMPSLEMPSVSVTFGLPDIQRSPTGLPGTSGGLAPLPAGVPRTEEAPSATVAEAPASNEEPAG
jgi:hypothetical protein